MPFKLLIILLQLTENTIYQSVIYFSLRHMLADRSFFRVMTQLLIQLLLYFNFRVCFE